MIGSLRTLVFMFQNNSPSLSIHEMNEESLSKTLKESVDPKGIILPPPPFTY